MAGTKPSRDRFFEELNRLRLENTKLKALLSDHGIQWQEPAPCAHEAEADQNAACDVAPRQLASSEKVALFRHLFHGRSDVYPVRWESAKGKSGYAPACGNEWKPGVCGKPRVKCGECEQRMLLPVTDQVVYDHLAGRHTVGIYPLSPDDTCNFVAVDFDNADWRDDVRAFMQSCREMEVPVATEISRSGEGAHAWIFFAVAVPARDARRLGAALISRTCARTRQLSLSSYDRLFPNQDTLPKGGFGNLIALPLQKAPREQGCSVFVDDGLKPCKDQWAFLASLKPMLRSELESAVFRSTGGGHPLDVAFVTEEEESKPWERRTPEAGRLPGPMPETLDLVLANRIFIRKSGLPQPLANRLVRLAAFQNPEFYKAQAMRLSVWNKPRVISCADNFPQHIGLPRGCLESVLELLADNQIRPSIQDERVVGRGIAVEFAGELRADQNAAVEAMVRHDIGVLCAPTAFGKTVTAAAVIARRGVSTLILVHRTELLRQWQERLRSFLRLPNAALGVIGGGKRKPSHQIDVAVMQSLARQDDLAQTLDDYGQVIVDECHHLSAFSFESILKQVKARYVIGLTATPVRRDGHHPIIFMQCGPIRHSAARPQNAPVLLNVLPQHLNAPEMSPDATIQDVFRILAGDANRNNLLARDIIAAYNQGRKVIVLTERTAHIGLLLEAIGSCVKNCFVMHGRLSKKERCASLARLGALDESAPRVLLATGRLIGEGFDHPPLDTLVLAMPISWKGTLQQYAGRLHREHACKRDVRIYDYIEYDHPLLARMWEKRRQGYRAMGYEIHLSSDHHP